MLVRSRSAFSRTRARFLFQNSSNTSLLQTRFKATISDFEIDQRGHGHGPGEPYANKMEFVNGMPTPPLSRRASVKSKSLCAWT